MLLEWKPIKEAKLEDNNIVIARHLDWVKPVVVKYEIAKSKVGKTGWRYFPSGSFVHPTALTHFMEVTMPTHITPNEETNEQNNNT